MKQLRIYRGALIYREGVMWQSVAWFFYELRNTAEVLWYNGSALLLIALVVLASATWFSLRRS